MTDLTMQPAEASALAARNLRVLVLDPHPIFRRGFVASLHLMDEVESVCEAASLGEALGHPALGRATLVVVDASVGGGVDVLPALREVTEAKVLVCAADAREPAVLRALRAGAVGCMRKDTLTHEGLRTTIASIAGGTAVLDPELLAMLVEGDGPAPDDAVPTPLTDREQRVLSLIADGLPTREVALELSYSERTVKSILHDVVTKLDARSRSHAIARAVRHGII
jgi:DNA-binding NarL/FixJ family response regulator